MIACGRFQVRILLDYRPALRRRTGVGAYIHETARALVETAPPGEALVLFTSSWRDRATPGVVPGATVVDRPVPVRALNFAWHRLEWPPVERLAGGGLDVVHAAHPLLIPSRHAARLVTIHDLDFLDHPERTHAEIRRDYAPLAGAHARRADHVVAVSQHTADAVQARLGVPADRITICRPGAPDWPARTVEPGPGAWLLFIGSLEPRKNLDVLIDAYARLVARDAATPRLVLAGRHTSAAASVIQRATTPPLAGRVDLPGYVDEPTKRSLFEGALALVLPSHEEGFGMPVVEAMTVGVPVVAADRGALPEVVGSAGRLVDADDPEAWAAAMAAVASDAGLRRAMAEAGRRQAAQFTWKATATAMRGAWQRAIAHRSR